MTNGLPTFTFDGSPALLERIDAIEHNLAETSLRVEWLIKRQCRCGGTNGAGECNCPQILKEREKHLNDYLNLQIKNNNDFIALVDALYPEHKEATQMARGAVIAYKIVLGFISTNP